MASHWAGMEQSYQLHSGIFAQKSKVKNRPKNSSKWRERIFQQFFRIVAKSFYQHLRGTDNAWVPSNLVIFPHHSQKRLSVGLKRRSTSISSSFVVTCKTIMLTGNFVTPPKKWFESTKHAKKCQKLKNFSFAERRKRTYPTFSVPTRRQSLNCWTTTYAILGQIRIT